MEDFVKYSLDMKLLDVQVMRKILNFDINFIQLIAV